MSAEARVQRSIVLAIRGRGAADNWLVGGLRDLGYRVTVVGLDAGDRPAPKLKGVSDRVASLWLSWKGARLAAETDSVFVAGNYMAAVLSLAVPPPRGCRRAPAVGMNMILMDDLSRLVPRRTLHRLALRKPGIILTVNSADLAREYAALLRVSDDRFAVLHDSWPVGAAFRQPTGEGDFVFIGGKRRDWGTAIAAARVCRDIPFEIIARKVDWPTGLVVPANVHVRYDTPPRVFYQALRECRPAVVPARNGGNLGLLVLVHGAIAGKPVAATRTPELAPYYPPDCGDLLVPPFDSDAMARVVSRLWNGRQHAIDAAQKLQSHVRAQCSPERYLRELADIIERARLVAAPAGIA